MHKCFAFTDEVLDNPYKGIMTFNHFRGGNNIRTASSLGKKRSMENMTVKYRTVINSAGIRINALLRMFVFCGGILSLMRANIIMHTSKVSLMSARHMCRALFSV